MGLFHYHMWDFSKSFHIFVRGVYILNDLNLTSNGVFLNILPMGLFHYHMWDFSKSFHIFVRGVYILNYLNLQNFSFVVLLET